MALVGGQDRFAVSTAAMLKPIAKISRNALTQRAGGERVRDASGDMVHEDRLRPHGIAR
jgi:hypothetical protein